MLMYRLRGWEQKALFVIWRWKEMGYRLTWGGGRWEKNQPVEKVVVKYGPELTGPQLALLWSLRTVHPSWVFKSDLRTVIRVCRWWWKAAWERRHKGTSGKGSESVPFLQEFWDLIFPLILGSSRLSKTGVPADLLASLQNRSTSLTQCYSIKYLRWGWLDIWQASCSAYLNDSFWAYHYSYLLMIFVKM